MFIFRHKHQRTPAIFDDDFERAASESAGRTGNGLGNIGSGGNSGNYVKQKDFIIKKMFKVPSNE